MGRSATSDVVPLDAVNRTLSRSRHMSKQLVRPLAKSDPQMLNLIEEHLANIVLHWLGAQGDEDAKELSVRDFSQLTKLLLDMTRRRGKIPGMETSSAIPSAEQLAAIERSLIGAKE